MHLRYLTEKTGSALDIMMMDATNEAIEKAILETILGLDDLIANQDKNEQIPPFLKLAKELLTFYEEVRRRHNGTVLDYVRSLSTEKKEAIKTEIKLLHIEAEKVLIADLNKIKTDKF